jgi:hypothetical protein
MLLNRRRIIGQCSSEPVPVEYNFEGTAKGNFTAKVLQANGSEDSSAAYTVEVSNGEFHCDLPALASGRRYSFKSQTNIQSITKVPEQLSNGLTSFAEMFMGCTSLQSVCELPSSTITDFSNIFADCTALTSVTLFDTSNGTNFYGMFVRCSALANIPLFDTSKGEIFRIMLKSTAIETVPQLDFSHGWDCQVVFSDCPNLKYVPNLSFGTAYTGSNTPNICRLLGNCPALVSIGAITVGNNARTSWQTATDKIEAGSLYGDIFSSGGKADTRPFDTACPNLTTIGGFANLDDCINLMRCSSLTRASVLNVFNNLAVAGTRIPQASGTKPTATTTLHYIILHPNTAALLSNADVDIAMNKGWDVKVAHLNNVGTDYLAGTFVESTDTDGVYHIKNLVCDGTQSTIFETGKKLFDGISYPNGFRLFARFTVTIDKSENTIMACRDRSLSASGYPGLSLEIGNTSVSKIGFWCRPSFQQFQSATATDKNTATVTYNSTGVTLVLNGNTVTSSTAIPTIDSALVLGCAIDGSGSKYRFATMVLWELTLTAL